jgi:hypothetical protein
MNEFLKWLLIGFGSGLIVFPIGLGIFSLVKSTLERRKIKKMINKGQFLKPIDERDYDTEAWKNQITPDPDEKYRLNQKIFKTPVEATA